MMNWTGKIQLILLNILDIIKGYFLKCSRNKGRCNRVSQVEMDQAQRQMNWRGKLKLIPPKILNVLKGYFLMCRRNNCVERNLCQKSQEKISNTVNSCHLFFCKITLIKPLIIFIPVFFGMLGIPACWFEIEPGSPWIASLICNPAIFNIFFMFFAFVFSFYSAVCCSLLLEMYLCSHCKKDILLCPMYTLIFFIFEVTVTGAVILRSVQTTSNLTEIHFNASANYYQNQTEELFHCCGINGPEDYIIRNWTIPDSCKNNVTIFQNGCGSYKAEICARNWSFVTFLILISSTSLMSFICELLNFYLDQKITEAPRV